MKNILGYFAVKVLRGLNLLFRPLQIREKVTVISRQSNQASLDIVLLTERLQEYGVKPVILTKTLEKSISGMLAYSVHLLQQMYHIATSKIVLIDGYCLLVSILPKKEGQSVIQMWHALGAIKKFGWQNTENPDGHNRKFSEIMNMHGNYDYVLAPGTVTGRFFAEAFRVRDEQLVYCGLPRIDFLKNKDDRVNSCIKEQYPCLKEKPTVLYVPTFRKGQELDLKNFVLGFNYDRFNLVIKKHFLDCGNYEWAKEVGAIVDSDYTSLEWLRVSEKVITDYSAISLEAAVLEREIYIYQSDVNCYQQKVGLNIDLKHEAIGIYVCEDEKTLFSKLEEPYLKDAVVQFKEKYFDIVLDNCTQELCEFIISLLHKEYQEAVGE